MHLDFNQPYGLLVFGVLSFVFGVVGTFTGKAWARAGRVIYRAKEPKRFWSLIGIQYACGIFIIGYFLYKVN